MLFFLNLKIAQISILIFFLLDKFEIKTLLGPEYKRSFTPIAEYVKFVSSTNFEQFPYSRTFLKNFVNVQNQAKEFSTYMARG